MRTFQRKITSIWCGVGVLFLDAPISTRVKNMKCQHKSAVWHSVWGCLFQSTKLCIASSVSELNYLMNKFTIIQSNAIARQNRPRINRPDIIAQRAKQSRRLCPVSASMIYHVYGSHLLLRYKIAPMISRSCLRPKISLCALTSSNNGTSPAIVTHNSSEESDKKSVRVRWLLVREKVGPIISRNCMWQKIGRLCWLCFTPTFSRISLRQKIGPCALGNRQQSS